MKKIFKYLLAMVDYQTIDIKKPAILLSVEEQNDGVMLYALVDDLEDSIPVDVRIIRTGNPITDDIENYKFLGTIKLAKGRLMFHIFARYSKGSEKKNQREEQNIFIIDEFVNIKKDKSRELMVA